MTDSAHPNINHVWAGLLVEELLRAGAGLFCLAPGSRSTPLATAVASNPRARHVMHYDERGTAFCALGYARATRRPAVWITTSGTAVANGFPAVVESSVDGVPLILLTADRPPELRDTGANQTIDQVKMFGDYVRWQVDVPAPTDAIDPAVLLTTADQAVHRARRSPAGPVHVNCMFREPLAPEPDGGEYSDYLRSLDGWREQKRPYTLYTATSARPSSADLRSIWSRLRTVERGLVVAGRLDTLAQADAVRWLSDRLGWPLLPDVCSQLRLGGGAAPDHAAYHYDLALASPAFRERAAPEAVLYFGGRATSKRLNQFLADAHPALFAAVRESPTRMDPHHVVTDHIEADILTFCRELTDLVEDEREGPSSYAAMWKEADGIVSDVIEDRVGHELSEPAVAQSISRRAPDGSGLVAASSMPVRDLDMFADAGDRTIFVSANRGASGIDGTVATAVGMAYGLQAPVTLLIGDLAFLHDLNSLAMVRACPDPIVIVAVNNHGGGIFSFLPISRHEEVFEPYFGTPHECRFEGAAGMFGIPYRMLERLDHLEDAYLSALESGKSHVLEVVTDRQVNVKFHRTIESAVAGALER